MACRMCFFFSSRRRHTRCGRDWSSDVCSSDLLETSRKVTINGGFSRAWRGATGLDIPLSDRDRKEISGGAAYSLTPHLTAFGSIGTTVRTFDDNGAGTTLSGGVSFWFATAHR